MDNSPLISIGLPIALAIIMFGLGLSLSLGDFRAVARAPKAVVVALAIQTLILPCAAWALVIGFDVDPLLAVGVMLLAASPGGTSANLLSHLFHGDVALNVTLTAINSVLAVVTIPVITNLAIDHFDATGDLGLQFDKIVQVIAIVLVPVALGMWVRHLSAGFAARADRPVRIFSIVILAVVAIGAILGERDKLGDYLQQIGLLMAIFCIASLSVGYAGARLFNLGERQAVACAMEVGIHNTTVALTIALSVLDSTEVAIPVAVYSIVMYVIAAAFGYTITRGRSKTDRQVSI